MQFLHPPIDPFANQECNWKIADNPEQYEKVKDTVSYGPEDITYKHNSEGFRCDEFDDWQNHSIRILFAGCSLTEGVGLPLEHTWAKIFHSKVCNLVDKEIPFWSIARGATGIDHMVRYMNYYLPRLRPHLIISYVPFSERRERWFNDFFGPWSNESLSNEAKVLLDEKFVLYQTEKNLTMIDLMLEKYQSSMICSTVDYQFKLDYMNLQNIYQCTDFIHRKDLARDGIHAGPNTNKAFANLLFNHFKDVIFDKVNKK
jgi:hypothetical protein